nr:MAG TPA: hypothetical protein [Caudoviricetes sp.]
MRNFLINFHENLLSVIKNVWQSGKVSTTQG